MFLLGFTGYMQQGRFWRYVIFGALAILELPRPHTTLHQPSTREGPKPHPREHNDASASTAFPVNTISEESDIHSLHRHGANREPLPAGSRVRRE